MDSFHIIGKNKLKGEISISGSKNTVLPIMAATIIFPGEYILTNVPKLRDTLTMIRLLKIIGAKIEFSNNIIKINTRSCDNPRAPYELVKTMRASFYVLGPLLSRFEFAEVSLPGGCAWGPRPINFHLDALKALGAEVSLVDGMILAKGKLKGAFFKFKKSSVGATGNSIMAAVRANGISILENCAIEPDIISLCEFLKKMGMKINGVGTKRLVINGIREKEVKITYRITPDRIEAGTFLIASAITRGHITINNVIPNHLRIVINNLKNCGNNINEGNDYIEIMPSESKIKPSQIKTDIYPGFPTDLQAQWMALMTQASGISYITENIYKDRFTHIGEMTRLGASILLKNNIAKIFGNDKLIAAPVMSTDIRASAGLIIAALAAEGKSTISRIYHIDRGYDNIEKKLSILGGDITRKGKERLS